MRVLLIQAYLGGNEPLVVPLGLLSIAATLAPHHEVRVVDTNISAEPFALLPAEISAFVPDIIGVSLRNIDSTNKREVVFYYRFIDELLTAIRSVTAAPIVMGGSGFSMFAADIMALEPRIDFGVYLEGEEVFGELLDSLDRPETVGSIYFRDGQGRVVFTGHRRGVDPGLLPGPRWDLLTNPLPYTHFRDAFGVETKRGCALSCIYCIYGFLNGKSYRLKPAAAVVDELARLVELHQIRRFTFIDSVFNLPIGHARAVCTELIRRQLPVKWSAWMSEQFLDRDFLDLIKEAGCDHIILSPDGYTDAVLSALGKNIGRRDIETTYDLLCADQDFEVSYNFFRNPPGQTIANFLGMLGFCLRAKVAMRRRVHFELSTLRIEPHTHLYEIALAEGLISRDQPLLEPVYYRNRRTWYIDRLFDAVLPLIGK